MIAQPQALNQEGEAPLANRPPSEPSPVLCSLYRQQRCTGPQDSPRWSARPCRGSSCLLRPNSDTPCCRRSLPSHRGDQMPLWCSSPPVQLILGAGSEGERGRLRFTKNQICQWRPRCRTWRSLGAPREAPRHALGRACLRDLGQDSTKGSTRSQPHLEGM